MAEGMGEAPPELGEELRHVGLRRRRQYLRGRGGDGEVARTPRAGARGGGGKVYPGEIAGAGHGRWEGMGNILGMVEG